MIHKFYTDLFALVQNVKIPQTLKQAFSNKIIPFINKIKTFLDLTLKTVQLLKDMEL